ncbi:MBL fold metallo-hydrolase [Pullulanibacillus sp. KACC 23026]|uniref:MBL fold metallo-hydrolase n=1 Tax=Pullulanibacillus sp. KACC 23026 TaxID=3028315 RepID=UPI0023B13671|nr:MBL fold metallo-hydrolase [Pullulanibacillus sp. KACC 23026]WEG11314.1 MBL fold metallo-hydrolase [Pullulanibacillus sp. KACC 23026]
MTQPEQLGEKLFIIDTYDLGLPRRTGCYVLLGEDGVYLVETSASPSKPLIEKGLSELGFGREAVKAILLTHIHLDHAGGAGLFARDYPNASIIVHPRGLRHLADPSRLIAGAQAVYGEDFDRLFNPILPIPKKQLRSLEDGEQLELSPDRHLTFIDSPGHAKHHYCIFDSLTKGMFVGDTVGLRYASLEEKGTPLFLPTTSPNQFDPDAMRNSIKRVQAFRPERLYFGHYSFTENVEEVYRQVNEWLDVFLEISEPIYKRGGDYSEIAASLERQVMEKSAANTLPDDHPERQMITIDLQVSSMGLVDYFHRKEK